MIDSTHVRGQTAWNKARILVFGIAAIAPLAYLINLVRTLGVNVPFHDQWELVPLLRQQDQGDLDLGDLWAQHNEHRLLLPRLLMIGLARVGHWNVKYEMYCNIGLAVLILAFLILLLRNNRSLANSRAFPWIVLSFSLIVFSPAQWENWLWGWQVQWYMNVVGFLGAVFGLNAWPQRRPRREGVAFAVGAALFGTMSLSLGIFIWLACLPSLIFKRELRKFVPIWLGAGALSTGAYLIGYVKPVGHPPLTEFLVAPVQFAEYVFIYMGNFAGGWNLRVAGPVGIVLVSALVGSLAVLVVRHRQLAVANLQWVSLGLYALVGAVTTGIGRVGFGFWQASSSRYTSISMLGLIGAFVLTLVVIRASESDGSSKILMRLASPPFRLIICALPLASLLVYSYPRAVEDMKDRHAHIVGQRSCLHASRSSEDPCLRQVYNPISSSELFSRVEYLRKREWAGFTSESVN